MLALLNTTAKAPHLLLRNLVPDFRPALWVVVSCFPMVLTFFFSFLLSCRSACSHHNVHYFDWDMGTQTFSRSSGVAFGKIAELFLPNSLFLFVSLKPVNFPFASLWFQWENPSTMRPGSGSTKWWVMVDVHWWTLGGRRVSVPDGELSQV